MQLPQEHLVSQRIKPPLMRSVNGIGLLNIIGEHGPISRATLAKLSRLSKPTVSSQVETLIRQGLVIEVGPGESGSKGGQKAYSDPVQRKGWTSFRVEIDFDRIRIAVSDLEGAIVEQRARPIGSYRTAGTVLAAVGARLEAVIHRLPRPESSA